MTALNTPQPIAAEPSLSGFARTARFLYLIGTALFLGSVVLQVFFAGAALLVSTDYLHQHRSFAHVVELVTFAVAIVALFARLPGRVLALSWLPVGLFILQYVFLHAIPSMGLPTALRALHAVNALVIFWNSVYLLRAAWGLVRNAQGGDARVR